MIVPLPMQLAAVLIAKNEAPYLVEWVAHHRALGFDQFLIYDNESTDETPQVLARLAHLPGLRAIPWSVREGHSPQVAAYCHALGQLRGRADYAAFIDADEFLIPSGGIALKDILANLERFPDFGGLAINQVLFGANEQEHYAPEPVLQRFPQRRREAGETIYWTKTIFRLAREPRFNWRLSRNGRWRAMQSLPRYNASSQRLTFREAPDKADIADLSTVQLNHYIVKSREEFTRKRSRGGGMGGTKEKRLQRYNEGFFNAYAGANSVLDEATMPFAETTAMRISELEALIGTASAAG